MQANGSQICYINSTSNRIHKMDHSLFGIGARQNSVRPSISNHLDVYTRPPFRSIHRPMQFYGLELLRQKQKGKGDTPSVRSKIQNNNRQSAKGYCWRGAVGSENSWSSSTWSPRGAVGSGRASCGRRKRASGTPC